MGVYGYLGAPPILVRNLRRGTKGKSNGFGPYFGSKEFEGLDFMDFGREYCFISCLTLVWSRDSGFELFLVGLIL